MSTAAERNLPAVDEGTLVLRSSRGHAWLADERHVLLPRWARVVPGDRVAVDAAGRISGLVPRRNILRRQVGARREQVLAASLDQVALVVAPGPLLREGFLARSLCGAAAERIEPLIVFQKVDLDGDHAMAARAGLYAALGFPVVGTSAKTGEGLAHLKRVLEGRTTAFLGHSGVGKSSLLNVLYGLDLKVGHLDRFGRGRHVTSLAGAHPVGEHGWVIDLPGVREFGLADLPEEAITRGFPEIASAAPGCRYPGCLHLGEIGCAVEAAEEEGRIDPVRLEAYRSIQASYRAGDEGGGRG